ncbi:hypothetical protein GEMRC1_004165 [Eukaryota sp. GEM-RC1]
MSLYQPSHLVRAIDDLWGYFRTQQYPNPSQLRYLCKTIKFLGARDRTTFNDLCRYVQTVNCEKRPTKMASISLIRVELGKGIQSFTESAT